MGFFRDRDRSSPFPVDGIDSEIDTACQVAKTHVHLDMKRPKPSKLKGDTCGPSSASANTPKRGWHW